MIITNDDELAARAKHITTTASALIRMNIIMMNWVLITGCPI